MNLTLDRKALVDILGTVCRAAGKQSWHRFVCIETSEGVLSFRASDSVIHTEVRIPMPEKADAEDGELVAVPAETLLAVVRAAAGEQIEVERRGAAVRLRSHNDRWDILGTEPTQMPPRPGNASKAILRTPASKFAEAVSSVVRFVAKESSRYAISAVCIEKGSAVATDGRVMASCDGLPKSKSPILLPDYLAVEALRVAQQSADLEISASGGWAHVTCDDGAGGKTIVSGAVVEGVFPPWENVIPTTEPVTKLAEVVPEILSTTVAQAATLCDAESAAVRFDFGDRVTLSARSSSSGESVIERLWRPDGDTVEVGLFPGNLEKVAKSAPGPIDIEVHGEKKPVVFRSGKWLAVVMPVSLG